MYNHRAIEHDIYKHISDSENYLAIVGPRRCGKSTVLKYLQRNWKQDNISVRYITFEDSNILHVFQEDIQSFATLYFGDRVDILIIDEFQYAKNAGKNLKYLYDIVGKHIIISGSSSLDIISTISQAMVGRIHTLFMHTFSFAEYMNALSEPDVFDWYTHNIYDIFDIHTDQIKLLAKVSQKKINTLFAEYIIFGGYPQVVCSTKYEQKIRYLQDIFNNYLQKDIRSLLGITDTYALSTLIKALAIQIGQTTNYNHLAHISGYKERHIKDKLSILTSTGIIDVVTPFFTNKQTELVKNPKIYFCDTGLRNALLNDMRSFDDHTSKGALFENIIYRNLKQIALTKNIQVQYWRTKSQAEMDFVIEDQGRVIGIECKYMSTPKKTLGKSVYSFIDKYSPKKVFMITKDSFYITKVSNTEVIFLPGWSICI